MFSTFDLFRKRLGFNLAEEKEASIQSFPMCREIVEREIIRIRDRYRARASWVRFLFRTSGVIIIVASVILPLMAGVNFESFFSADIADRTKFLTISGISVLIAALSSIRTFFKWDRVWRIMRAADYGLTFALDEWELILNKLTRDQDHSEAEERAFEVTQKLIKDAKEVILNEFKEYFDETSTITQPAVTLGDHLHGLEATPPAHQPHPAT